MEEALKAPADQLASASLTVQRHLNDPELPPNATYSLTQHHPKNGIGIDSVPLSSTIFFDATGQPLGGLTECMRPSGVRFGQSGDAERAGEIAPTFFDRLEAVLSRSDEFGAAQLPSRPEGPSTE